MPKKHPLLNNSDRQIQITRAAKFKYQTIHALSIICHSEADQIKLHAALTKRYPSRKIKVIVS